jgi:hypothetical protein
VIKRARVNAVNVPVPAVARSEPVGYTVVPRAGSRAVLAEAVAAVAATRRGAAGRLPIPAVRGRMHALAALVDVVTVLAQLRFVGLARVRAGRGQAARQAGQQQQQERDFAHRGLPWGNEA